MIPRVAPLVLAAWLLAALLGQANHYLSVYQLHLWCGGLFVTWTALHYDHRAGAASSFLAGLFLDAASPLPFGTQALLLLAAHTAIHHLRPRLPREELVVQIMVALLANLVLFITVSFLHMDTSTEPSVAWMRVLGDLIVSQVVLAVIAPWFFAVQARLGGWTRPSARRRAF